LVWLLLLLGCVDRLQQVAGTGSVYSVRCSAEMDVKGEEYVTRCTPAACLEGWRSTGLSQVVVALDPGTKLVGYAERVCIQDLSDATALFPPASDPEPAPDH
jgi:hypothetical protein